MKKILKIAIFFITFIFFSYDISALSYEEAVKKTQMYLIKEYDFKNTYSRYLITVPNTNDLSYYENYDKSSNSFGYGGLLSEKEFNITTRGKGNRYSYLYESDDYWTLTTGKDSLHKKVISLTTGELKIDVPENNKPGLRVTEYVRNDATIVGTGEYSDPWILVPQYEVKLKVNVAEDGEEKGKLKDPKTGKFESSVKMYLTSNSIEYIEIDTIPGYQYLGNTCGYIINDANVRNGSSNTLIVHEISRDFECTINFGEKPLEIKLDNDNVDDNDGNLPKVYLLPGKSWYSDEQAQNQTSKVNNVPTKQGHTTIGFYLNKEQAITRPESCNGTKYIDGTGNIKVKATGISRETIGNDTKLYPCYRPNEYKVNYDCNNGDGTVEQSTHIYSRGVTLNTNGCTREGYKFVGWNTNKSGTGASYPANTEISDNIIENPSEGEEITLYAEWEQLTKYTATFELNGASSLSKKSIYCYTDNPSAGCEITTPSITPASGFKALGFNTVADSTTQTANQSTKITIKSNITYYAITKSSDPITVNFDNNGATAVTDKLECYRYNGKNSCKITSPIPTVKTGYTLIGFNTNPNATNKQWTANTEKDISADTTYYVIQSKEIKGTFNTNGASSVGASTVKCTLYNTAESCQITTPSITPATGFSVIGWNTNQNATTSSVDINTSTSISGNTTYYAITGKQITASFSANGAASIGSASQSCYAYNGSADGCSITSPTITAASGFTVVGWNTNQNATSSELSVNTSTVIKTNKTYYAITRKQITVTFNTNGAESIGSPTKSCYAYNGSTAGCSVTSPGITPASGFTALGWNTSSSATNSAWNVNQAKTFTANATYNAITRKQITVTFEKNGAASISSESQSCYAYNGSTAGCSITSPSITAASGFSVLGWNTNASGTSSTWTQSTASTIKTNTTYHAITRKQITVTFKTNGASAIGSTTQSCYSYNGSTAGCSITSPSITAASGFSVLGWNTSASATSSTWSQSTPKTITANATYNAITRKQITITFNRNGANAIGSTSKSCYAYNGSTAGCSVTSPTITASTGFTVVGWNTSASATTSGWTANSAKTVTTNTTYHAITKSSSSVTVTFNTNGASSIGSTSLTCYKYNGADACNITSPTITAASGFTVVGWNTSSGATSNAWSPSTSKSFETNATYYAITKSSSQITISFVQNGAGSIGATSQSCYRYNGASTCNITSPSITAASGFTVVGWNTSSGATTSTWTQGTAKSFSAAATYYAITKSSSQITITFNKNGASAIGSTSQSCYRYNGASSCSVTSPSITAVSGFTVVGWNTSASATSNGWSVGTAKAFSSNATYNAITKSSSQITVSFVQNGASAIGSTSQSCYRYNGASTCNITSPSITAAGGFTVIGWNTSSGATSNGWTQNTAKAFSSGATYYAITRSSSQITVSFVANGASSISSTSQSCYRYNGATSCSVTSPTITAASGFTVIGWNTSSGATSNGWSVSTAKAFSSNATYYAITRSSSQITVTFNKNGAGSIGATSLSCYRYNGSSSCNITSPAITAASGFSVIGWNTSASATSNGWSVSTAKAFSAAATYNAITRKTITVTYNPNGGSVSPTSGTCYTYNGSTGTCAVTLPTPSRSGYKFNGWYTATSGGTKVGNGGASYSVSAGATIYAQWGQLHTLPIFTYTGSYQLVKDDDTVIASGTNTKVTIPSGYSTYTGNWKIRFLSSGKITFHELRGASNGIDVFLVGGGGNGGSTYSKQAGRHGYSSGGGGGAGGYRTTKKGVSVSLATYDISIGATRTKTTAFSQTANPGGNGANAGYCDDYIAGGTGGAAGGKGGYNSADGLAGGTGGCEFDDCTLYSKRYGGGGGGGHSHNGRSSRWLRFPRGVGYPGAGGSGGGGQGNNQFWGSSSHNGQANTGGGGGGASFVFDKYDACGDKAEAYYDENDCNCWSANGCFNVSRTTEYPAGKGGSGIVIIRNKR